MSLIGTVSPEFVFQNRAELLRVCGVFSSGAYLESSAGEICMLHDGKYGLLPLGIGVEDIRAALAILALDVGMQAQLREGRLIFPGDNQIILKNREMPCVSSLPFSEEAFRSAARQLKNSGRGAVPELAFSEDAAQMGDNLFAKIAVGPLGMLKEGIRMDLPERITAALERLIGLGPGLTPSLDDFVTGVLYTFGYARRCWRWELPGMETLVRCVRQLPRERTGKYSWAYLLAAAEGKQFSILEQVLCDFSEGAVEQLLQVGGHSGGDMMTGIVWAVNCVKNCRT